MSDSCSTTGCPRHGRFFSGETCPECHKAPFRGNDTPTDPAPPEPGSEPLPPTIPPAPAPSKALRALVGASLLLTLVASCASHARPPVASVASIVHRIEATDVQLHDANGTAFEVPRERICSIRPAEREGTLIVRFRFRSEPRFIGAAHFLRVIGVRNTTLALGFFTPQDGGLTACYLALERGRTIIAFQSGVVEHLSD